LQFGDFEPEIEAIIFGGFEQDLGDVGNGYGLAAAFGDNLFRSFEKLAERVGDADGKGLLLGLALHDSHLATGTYDLQS
jgi:hypothetical protein